MVVDGGAVGLGATRDVADRAGREALLGKDRERRRDQGLAGQVGGSGHATLHDTGGGQGSWSQMRSPSEATVVATLPPTRARLPGSFRPNRRGDSVGSRGAASAATVSDAGRGGGSTSAAATRNRRAFGASGLAGAALRALGPAAASARAGAVAVVASGARSSERLNSRAGSWRGQSCAKGTAGGLARSATRWRGARVPPPGQNGWDHERADHRRRARHGDLRQRVAPCKRPKSPPDPR